MRERDDAEQVSIDAIHEREWKPSQWKASVVGRNQLTNTWGVTEQQGHPQGLIA